MKLFITGQIYRYLRMFYCPSGAEFILSSDTECNSKHSRNIYSSKYSCFIFHIDIWLDRQMYVLYVIS